MRVNFGDSSFEIAAQLFDCHAGGFLSMVIRGAFDRVPCQTHFPAIQCQNPIKAIWGLGGLINPKHEEITAVYYFSALTTWIPERAKKHLHYIHALRTAGVQDVLGKFNLRNRKCPLCKGRYQAHEEKKTDINIAITLLADAVADQFDTALILSGDSDLAPVTTKLKQLCPARKIGIIIPQNQSAMNLKQHADFFKKIQDRDLKKSLLPEQLTYNGKTITAPAGWLPRPEPEDGKALST
jgi:uncharacterized LabA/DUF88 family protein